MPPKTEYDRRRKALFLCLPTWPARRGSQRVGGYHWRFKSDYAISGNVIVTRHEWQSNYGQMR